MRSSASVKGLVVACIAVVIVLGYIIGNHIYSTYVWADHPELQAWWDPETSKQLRLENIENEAIARSVVQLPKPPSGCPTGGGLIPSTEVLDKLDEASLRIVYRDYLSNAEVICNVMFRMGNIGPGGWEVCHDEYIRPKSNCLVYSIGIGNDFSFDDMTGQRYGCEVHAFDPSMHMKDNKRSETVMFHNVGVSGSSGYIHFNTTKWSVKTLADIRKMLGHKEKLIDIIKMNVNGSEWETLTTALNDDSLKNVSQFLFGTHSFDDGKKSILSKLKILKRLRDQGFRIFYPHKNSECPVGDKSETPQRTNCHEIHMLHIPACASKALSQNVVR